MRRSSKVELFLPAGIRAGDRRFLPSDPDVPHCGQMASEYAMRCNREVGHSGDHAAHCMPDIMVARWRGEGFWSRLLARLWPLLREQLGGAALMPPSPEDDLVPIKLDVKMRMEDDGREVRVFVDLPALPPIPNQHEGVKAVSNVHVVTMNHDFVDLLPGGHERVMALAQECVAAVYREGLRSGAVFNIPGKVTRVVVPDVDDEKDTWN